jgi:hypothetical protein
MSLTSDQVPDADPRETPSAALDPSSPPKPQVSWQTRLLRICFVIFTFEIGLFLVIVPWMDETWSLNTFQEMLPALQNVWIDPYFRGAITGLGLVNIYIASNEMVRLFRRAS